MLWHVAEWVLQGVVFAFLVKLLSLGSPVWYLASYVHDAESCSLFFHCQVAVAVCVQVSIGMFAPSTIVVFSFFCHIAVAVCMQVSIGMFAPSTGKIDDRWQRFMQFQIKRAREYFSQAESGVDFLDKNARWPVW